MRGAEQKGDDKKANNPNGLSTSTQGHTSDPEDQHFPNCMPFDSIKCV